MAEQDGKRVELGLNIGGFLNLQLSQRNDGQRWTARLIGFLDGESMLVTTPHDGGAPVPFYTHDGVTVRYLAGREIHGFTTWVRKVAVQPFPYMHLAFPRTIERVPFRQEERVPMDLPVKYQSVTQSDECGDGRILDLSAAGALLKAPESLGMPGDEVRLQFDVVFAGLESHVDVCATIRNVKPDEHRLSDGEHKLYGVQFQDLGEQSRLFIKGFVYERIVQYRE